MLKREVGKDTCYCFGDNAYYQLGKDLNADNLESDITDYSVIANSSIYSLDVG